MHGQVSVERSFIRSIDQPAPAFYDDLLQNRATTSNREDNRSRESKIEQPEVGVMRHTTLFPNGSRDFIIGLIALALAIVFWSAFIVPAI